ncbi:TetR/AcrR family transcriptional regulator [Lysinibacillus antri]|uniref:TetR/AcrR family transcriptional regulator n=1 Tax=Lysinibacillus antri TaxID=2498145 RepID=A0A3S0PQV1_9BACI|nr:TetR/AcrR family transcriptional regulator [Lysinibacillus antri]RUL54695.1 TetR/AcrR family transcriptional regulator [Lysinibacillus antri]
MVKKQLIMEKSLELFAESGFEATSIQQITERCGISKGAFYLHFKSKDELIYSLIDKFMSEFIADIERSVSEDKPKEELLYNFLYTTFGEFQQQANFAKVFLKEQVLSFNKELFERFHMYTTIINKIIFSVVQRQFKDVNLNMQLDLLFTINGLSKGYGELFLIDNYNVDLDKLCKAIVEKVTIIAEHATIQFITPDYFASTNQHMNITKEQIVDLMIEVMGEVEQDSIVHESLVLLRNHLIEPTLSDVLIEGLLKNIRSSSQCKWIAYLYQIQLEQKK